MDRFDSIRRQLPSMIIETPSHQTCVIFEWMLYPYKSNPYPLALLIIFVQWIASVAAAARILVVWRGDDYGFIQVRRKFAPEYWRNRQVRFCIARNNYIQKYLDEASSMYRYALHFQVVKSLCSELLLAGA
ncbi:hypothetical protein P175DRAFT_0527851 [Aspergillus ochraceoroseus IBT 24754]|uniref:Uncharacterized protein n=1 Tax=Aspergillus ochraceoroseus IBT 24754 TaxID=1392256 RepID=A0A2T5M763_9EURO|nr:uncharacterized protein P175DRAFT_0527851 [Aspergillus ochraceoroseus IBT 24754]PTU24380.1 hypothetical protein P175DRAFT_0527851 [Aspergillus ochraceoroseus IBT 24754]